MDKSLKDVKMITVLADIAYEVGMHQDEDVPMELRLHIVGQRVVHLLAEISAHATEDDLHMMIQLLDALEERVKNYE